eukprot:9429432-Prorocentrum_lima.AAC.1
MLYVAANQNHETERRLLAVVNYLEAGGKGAVKCCGHRGGVERSHAPVRHSDLFGAFMEP